MPKIIHMMLGMLALSAASAFAGEEAIRKALTARFPEEKVGSVAKTPYFGLYEAFIGSQLVYTDENAKFLFMGSMLDAKTLQNLTERRMMKFNASRFESLPLDLAIKTVKGDGKRVLAVFSDPRCPYCKRLEKTLAEVTNVTVYTLLYPILSGSEPISRSVWCAPDRQKAWDDLMLRDIPPQAASCDTPIAKITQLGRQLGVNGTPALIFSSGRIVSGAIPASELEKYLSEPKVR